MVFGLGIGPPWSAYNSVGRLMRTVARGGNPFVMSQTGDSGVLLFTFILFYFMLLPMPMPVFCYVFYRRCHMLKVIITIRTKSYLLTVRQLYRFDLAIDNLRDYNIGTTVTIICKYLDVYAFTPTTET